MARDVSLMVTARDNYSSAIRKMATTTRSFKNDMKGLESKLTQLNRNKTTLQIDAAKAKSELMTAKKAFANTSDEASRLKLEAAQADYNNISDNLKLVSNQARQTEKDMSNLTDELSKHQNRAQGSRTSKGAALGTSSMLKQIAAAGATQMIGDSISGAANTMIGSAFGTTVGGAISSTISKAASGAAIGTMIAPGIGTAIGAAAGAVAGAVDGAMQIYEEKDDYFKQYVQGQYDDVKQKQEEMLSAGSELAATRETGMVSWTTMLGDESKAKAFTNDIKEMANSTPFLYEDLDQMAKTMKVFGYETENVLPTLTNIGDAGAALGMGANDINTAAIAIGRMKSTDKTSAEYLNLLIERGVPAYDYLAKSMGKTNKEVQEMVSRGLIPGSEAAQIITDAMGAQYGGAMATMSETYSGKASTLQGANDEMDVAMGEGFNAVRVPGMDEEINFLQGETGAKMEEAYNMIGQWQASLVNLQEEYQRDAITAVMDGTLGAFEGSDIEGHLQDMNAEYQSLLMQYNAGNEEAGAQMGALIAEAQSLANTQYMNSEGAQLEQQANIDLVNSIQSDTNIIGGWENAGMTMGRIFDQGIADAIRSDGWKITPAIADVMPAAGNRGRGRVPISGKHNAWGNNRIPYDNYPAILHEGEQVLPAASVKNHNSGGGVVVNLYGTTVREETDIEKIASALAREIELKQSVVI